MEKTQTNRATEAVVQRNGRIKLNREAGIGIAGERMVEPYSGQRAKSSPALKRIINMEYERESRGARSVLPATDQTAVEPASKRAEGRAKRRHSNASHPKFTRRCTYSHEIGGIKAREQPSAREIESQRGVGVERGRVNSKYGG